jgi:SOS-response transcriptional repressor LexA
MKDKNKKNGPGITLNREKLGNAVKQKRLQAELTLRELEENLGIDAATLCRIENGQIGAPDFDHLLALCQWLQEPPESFFKDLTTPLRARIHHRTKVNAGLPPPNLEDSENMDNKDICEHLMPNRDNYFTVTVTGESMIGEKIYDGDLLIVRKSQEANSGDLVIAEIDRKYCVKKFHKKGNSITLLSANPASDDIIVSEDVPFRIIGIVTHSIHKQQGSGPVMP